MSVECNVIRRGLPWFRLYNEIVDDAKLRLLAFEDRWHFVALMALKCGGILDNDAAREMLHRMVAVKLGVQVRELEAIAKRLAEVGLIDPETLQPLAWDRRQASSDSSRERTKEWRKRGGKPDRHCDADVTPEKEIKTKIEEEDQKQEQVRSRGSRLPKDWQPGDHNVRWALERRPDLNLQDEADKFRDYWTAKAGKDATKVDWSATWRCWIRNARSETAGRLPLAPRESLTAKSARINRDQDVHEEGKCHVALPR